MKIVFPKKN